MPRQQVVVYENAWSCYMYLVADPGQGRGGGVGVTYLKSTITPFNNWRFLDIAVFFYSYATFDIKTT